ncbi:chalcone isomerase family protein [Pseudomonas sp. HK3]
MAALQLNGVASYNELNKEYYIAGLLLSERISDPAEIGIYKNHKQMKLIVTADRWSPRQWKKQWQNNIAINNTLLSSDNQLQKDLAYFTSFLSKDLTNGDELVIEYYPQTGTRIQLNNLEFITTQDDRLFNYLVNTWIGKLPPSRDFKNRILSLQDDTESVVHKQLMMTHTVTASRIAQTNSWFVQSTEDKEKAEESARIEEQRQKKSALKQQQAQRIAEQKLNRKQSLEKSESAIKAEKLAQAKVAAAKRLEREQAAEKARIKKLKLIKERKAQEAQLAQYYFRDLHEWKLRQAVLAEVQYPAWARQFHQEGCGGRPI